MHCPLTRGVARLSKPFPNTETGDGSAYIPDQPVLTNQLRKNLPLVAASAWHFESERAQATDKNSRQQRQRQQRQQ
jgi:hypothetical protein